jgi:hypothetical protein
MKKTLILMILVLSIRTTAQEKTILTSGGIELKYQLTKFKEDKKKDVYLLQTTVLNTNLFDCYYLAPKNNINPFVVEFNVRNAEYPFLNITAQPSRLNTQDGKLYVIKKGDFISLEKEIKVPMGEAPIVTAKFWVLPKNIEEFR